MKFYLTTLNAKYVHSSLAVRCLYQAVRDDFDVDMSEFTINDSPYHIMSHIYRAQPDVLAVGCYIWNFNQVLTLCQNLKKACPHMLIVLGGPEVTYSPEDILKKYDFVDFVIIGEGEVTISHLFKAISTSGNYDGVDGIAYRLGDSVVRTAPRAPVANLDLLPFVYKDGIDDCINRIVYYESSRGCPYNCSYCLSGERGNVRYLSLDRVKRDIDFFVLNKVPLVKFVDRTFNADKNRAKEIFRYIIDTAADTRFHMELAGDLLDDETIELLSRAPRGLMQFEIGVQTTNPDTMMAINRRISFEPLSCNIRKLMDNDNIHIHLDLIAGLPFEDIQSFKRSFNQVMELKPHVLQLGFLKLLDGSAIRNNAAKFGYKYTSNAPYEIICNDFVSYGDMLLLHRVEEVFERLYNNGGFEKSLESLFDIYNNRYFDVFEDIADYFDTNGLFDVSLSKQKLYDVLHEYAVSRGMDIDLDIKYDYIRSNKSHLAPAWCRTNLDKNFEDKCYALLRDEEFKKNNLPNYFDVPAKKAIKTVHFDVFGKTVLLFDHESGAVLDVTDRFLADEILNI